MFSVLLIEDNPGDVALVEHTLADSEFTVQQTGMADSALQQLDTPGVDIVLLDLTLPNGQGTELVRRILGKSGAIPVVLLTGTDDETVVAEAIKDGISGFVSKNQIDRLTMLSTMHLAIKNRKGDGAINDPTLQALAERIQKMKEKSDEVIGLLEKKAGVSGAKP